MAIKFDTPDAAEAAFYAAIEQADLSALESIWSSDSSVVCIHPGSARIEGRHAVLESFSRMFAHATTDGSSLAFSICDTMHTMHAGLAIHLVRELVTIDGEPVSVMVATNIYHLEQGGWRMLLHHASHEAEGAFDDFDEQFDVDDTLEPSLPGPVLH